MDLEHCCRIRNCLMEIRIFGSAVRTTDLDHVTQQQKKVQKHVHVFNNFLSLVLRFVSFLYLFKTFMKM